ncbi:MAG: hypothetical protein EBX36_07270 [Planctomycetia bacterium]|nr:hypothetical protein [Planctomycetia bacterium]
MTQLSFIVAEMLLLAATLAGGPPWTAIAMVALVGLLGVEATATPFRGFRTTAIAPLVPGLLWLVAFRVTGNRELFFPYCMHLACGLATAGGGTTRGPALAGTATVAAFLVVRILQHATARVLAVEAAVAAVILGTVIAARVFQLQWPVRLSCPSPGRDRGLRSLAWRTAIASAGSLAAFAGLSL